MVHSMIRVLDEARSVDFYKRAFKLEVARRFDFETFSLTFLSNAESSFELELTLNKGRQEPYELGTGYGHLAVMVDDLDAEYKRLEGSGFAPRKLVDFQHDGRTLARFFFIKDPDGYDIEIIQETVASIEAAP